MSTRFADSSPQLAARVAGVLYLLIIAGGLFAEAFVRDAVLVPGDAAATAQRILANETLFRLGFTVHLSYLVCAVVLAVILFGFFRRVHSDVALLALAVNLVAIAVEALNLLNQFEAVRLLTLNGLEGLPAAHLQAIAYAALRLFASGFGISLTFFGVFCLAIGYLIWRSGFLPRALGALMGVAGLCYLINSYAVFLAPAVASALFPYILLPCLVAELALALWLTIRGVDVARWQRLPADR